MIYRTAHRATYRNLNNNLGTLSYRIAQLTSQIASERRINTPSDDPTGASKVLGTRTTLSNIQQYGNNIAVSDMWLSDSGNAIQSMKTTLDEIYTKAEQGSTDTYNDDQRQILAEAIKGLFGSLIQYGDTKIGDSYIFGGQKITTQPFSLQVEAQKVIAGCNNSDKWTGKVTNYGNAQFNNRPDLPIHSQDFLVEVVRAGGVNSRYYSTKSALNEASISQKYNLAGDKFNMGFTAGHTKYNGTEIEFKAGAANTTEYGQAADGNLLTFGGGADPTNVVIQPASHTGAGAAGATWDAATNTLTISLETDTSGRCVSTADEIATMVDGMNPPGLTCTANGTGKVAPNGEFSFNNTTTAEYKNGKVTVYLERSANDATGATAGTVENVRDAINAMNAAAGETIINFSPAVGSAYDTVVVDPATTKLQTGQPYTLAQLTVDPKGTQNDLIWSVKNDPDPHRDPRLIGSAGEEFSVAYVIQENPFDPNPTSGVTYDPNTKQITVHVAVDPDVYQKIFIQNYNDPQSPGYQNGDRANEMALKEAIKTTANDVKQMVSEHPDLKDMIDISLADGSSGDGKISSFPRTNFSEGYDGPALFRVSQDGGKTWGPPQSFNAGEYSTGDAFYNSYLGHASMTTNQPGKANDLVFTAKHQGTWGNDVRVEYNAPDAANQPLSITVGPNSWNICVNLATDDRGNPISTAEEVMAAINKHPEASQLVYADLANYHEGGGGIVQPMDCTSLSVAEPYEVNGVTKITELGHAGATISFPYTASAQKSPNIVYQAIEHGTDGNDIGIRYTTSADPTFYADPAEANESYQDTTTVRYETTADGKTVMVVHLATESLPSCPDATENPEASEKWKELYPLYSCTSARAVTATAGSVVQAIIDKNTSDPANAVIWPSLERWPDGLDSTAKVGPTNGTVWLTGGNDEQHESNHGVNLNFYPDGSSLQVGDIFEVPVGWYRGDDKEMEINASSGYRSTLNIPGNDVLGGNGEDGNILDTVQRLIWALENNDTELIAKELPNIKTAITQLTTLETSIGTRQIRNQFVSQNLDQAKYSSESYLSTVEDADFSKLITDLKNAQTVYEACLGATGLTSKVSLLNYI